MTIGSKVSTDFLKTFKKNVSSISGVVTESSKPPRYWYSFGNYVLNRIMSGSFLRGIPQGRITNLSGPSASGKSFVAANLVREAQKAGAIALVIDSENALDDDFMNKIGVNTSDDSYNYVSVVTIPHVTSVVSSFIKSYRAEYGESADAPQVLIVIDSLDMLMTETESDNYQKGVTKGDQGQRNKQLKQMLRSFVQDIKLLNVSIVVTSQVYKNQDVTNGEGLWIISDAVRYAASQIVLLTKLKLKADSTVVGIRMCAEGYKTRFCKPFSKVTIEVPYETGIDPLSGLKEVAVELGVLVKRGSRLQIDGHDETWFERDMEKYADIILQMCEERAQTTDQINGMSDEDELDMSDVSTRRERLAAKSTINESDE